MGNDSSCRVCFRVLHTAGGQQVKWPDALLRNIPRNQQRILRKHFSVIHLSISQESAAKGRHECGRSHCTPYRELWLEGNPLEVLMHFPDENCIVFLNTANISLHHCFLLWSWGLQWRTPDAGLFTESPKWTEYSGIKKAEAKCK